jgi:hypothetical protein
MGALTLTVFAAMATTDAIMKLTKLIAVTAGILGAAQMCATAQIATLNLSLTARILTQSTNVSTNAHTQVVTTRAATVRTFSTSDFIKRMAADTGTTLGRGAARLVVTNGTVSIVQGSTIVDVSGIISVSFGTNQLFSGSVDTNGLARPSEVTTQIARVIFDDTALNSTNGLRFYIQGVLTDTITDSVPNRNTGVFTETEVISMPTAAGEGTSGVGSGDERQIIVTGSLTGNGTGKSSIL